ncbi:phage antirepressor KilAC domain-containing protein [Yersinia enterocolitica]|uniref:phage antirepressor KilAC domain-containing protein n=1 Tax=Yersinia enterocolitica TaxID=630 RepID=UPI002891453E|nr:phage regulatory protein/antirepressor Ant [Yersinia enterocolitica]EKN6280746.1 phage regulatory protein/antirepressor Ant [Yersinia enterocolitica]ELY5203238.1 phage antirepressor KilAC domain-containing protein [Yersinia enterocolitica]ELZ4048904.1 phage antirepressor KilAC domain-containing protein [Yersinia enterocolitica]HDL7677270.1 phage antirepressor KilAC domain-containing protein [Yersinia enterocolitica]
MNNYSGVSALVVTMSSREIAVLVNSKHGDVKRSAERLCAGGILTAPLAQFDFEHNGNRYFEYRFNKRDSLVLVARLSPEFTAAVVDRWQELEQNLIPQTLPEALRLAANLAEEKQQLENQLSIAAPKVEFVDRYVKATGSMVFRQVCKLLSAKEPEFRLFLMDNRIMYRLSGGLIPHQQHIDAGRFEVKTGTNQINSHAFTQARFTPKGVRWVGGLWIEYLAKKGAA